MFKILVFQCATSDDFQVNMRGRDYISFSDMEYVDFFEVDNVDNTDSVLSMAFYICNDYDDERRPKGLRYSMSVGDIVVIYDEAYRCMPMGWDKLDLSDSDYKIIQSIMKTLETTNNEENKENESEEKEMGTTENRMEQAAAEKAKAIVGTVKDGLKGASEVALSLCDDVATEAKTIAAMSQQEAENHIKRKFKTNADKFIDWILDKLNIEMERSETTDSWFAPASGSADSKTTSRLKKAIADFKAVKNSGEKNGWKKFKDVLKAVFGIIFAVFIEVAKIVLKLAFALTVGVIRIGAVALTTILSCAGTINNDVVKPGVSAVKKVHTEAKGARARKTVGVNQVLN